MSLVRRVRLGSKDLAQVDVRSVITRRLMWFNIRSSSPAGYTNEVLQRYSGSKSSILGSDGRARSKVARYLNFHSRTSSRQSRNSQALSDLPAPHKRSDLHIEKSPQSFSHQYIGCQGNLHQPSLSGARLYIKSQTGKLLVLLRLHYHCPWDGHVSKT